MRFLIYFLDLYWMREAELKHSRVAMLAVVGSVAQEAGVVFPGLVSHLNMFSNSANIYTAISNK